MAEGSRTTGTGLPPPTGAPIPLGPSERLGGDRTRQVRTAPAALSSHPPYADPHAVDLTVEPVAAQGVPSEPGPSAVATRWASMPLRWQLVVGVLVIVAVALAAAGTATYVVLNRSLVSQVDDGLTSARDQARAPGGNLNSAITTWVGNGATVYFVAPGNGSYVLNVGPSSRGPGFDIAFDPVRSAADGVALAGVPVDSPATTVTLSTGDGRAIATGGTARLGGVPVQGTIVVVQPLSRVDSVVHRFVVIELLAMLVALLVVALAGSWFVRRALRPLQRVADTAGQVAVLPLDRGDVAIPARVPASDPATEVGQVASAVNAMLDHVETSLRTRQETEGRLRRFVSDAGHELRTPLAAVRGYAELVRRAGDEHPGQALASAARIESAAARMGVLVDDLLLLASLDEGRPLDQLDVDLAALVQDAVAEVRAAQPGHDWQIGPLGPDPRVVGDAARLHQVLTNLLATAAAYTPTGTTVTTSVLRVGDDVQLQVRDAGPGFPPDLLPRATERFARGEASRSRATGGSGLGLAIVRAIVESHGGDVSIDNDRGAVVTAHLPAPD
jgi:two-component system OmpR family sensor kinase